MLKTFETWARANVRQSLDTDAHAAVELCDNAAALERAYKILKRRHGTDAAALIKARLAAAASEVGYDNSEELVAAL